MAKQFSLFILIFPSDMLKNMHKMQACFNRFASRKMALRFAMVMLIQSTISYAQNNRLTFPYSQWTINIGGRQMEWHYANQPVNNESFIKAPAPGEWDSWYASIQAYRQHVRGQLGTQPPYIKVSFPVTGGNAISFDQFAWQLQLQPGETIEITGEYEGKAAPVELHVQFHLKYRGQEKSYAGRGTRKSPVTETLQATASWKPFSIKATVPAFSTDSFGVAPSLQPVLTSDQQGILQFRNIRLSVPETPNRKMVYQRCQSYLQQHARQTSLSLPASLAWSHDNFVMGFVYMWDHSFYDTARGTYRVDEYCRTMQQEFGGMQSVILWHSYPNIGVDNRNQFDFFDAMPGGMQALKDAVDAFHRNGVKVFITYNPWDLDTRRPAQHDYPELARVIKTMGADGIFLDTWRSAMGTISIFDTQQSIRNEVEKLGLTVAFTTEILPDIKDLYGPDALTSSWGQEIEPFHFTDLSHQKWLMPEHKQYFIKRMAPDKRPMLTHAWINGQGIQLWENIFGTMNLWKAVDRKHLRHMNAIWQKLGRMYLTDNWQPFVPMAHPDVIASRWITDSGSILNLADTSGAERKTVRVPVNAAKGQKYYDLWQGKALPVQQENGRHYVELELRVFGCLLETGSPIRSLQSLLTKQQTEVQRPLAKPDNYVLEQSMKLPLSYSYPKRTAASDTPKDLLPVAAYQGPLHGKHIWREGRCYPDMDGKDNHDLRLSRENGTQYVSHTYHAKLEPFSIMPRVVTNREFETFLRATQYRPRFAYNFLRHWNGPNCPPAIADEPVVYVSLEDARAYAAWAGMELPSEWEWQLAAQQANTGFRYNEVLEWNESERFDGYNRSVSLRGGCSQWQTSSSGWYLPGTPSGTTAGGAQPADAHVKYFLLYPGLDRAATIGFRCVKRQ